MDQQPDYAKAAMSEVIMQLVSNVVELRAQLLAAQARIAALEQEPAHATDIAPK